MKMVVCSVRDRASNTYGAPFFSAALGSALRSFADAVKNKADVQNVMASHPEDFDLYHLGFYYDDTATWEPLPHPLQIAVGKDIAMSKEVLQPATR